MPNCNYIDEYSGTEKGSFLTYTMGNAPDNKI